MDKQTGRRVPFRLNAPQRQMLAVMEGQRASGKPVRVILLKARQWGGSTLVQMYMAWHQLVLHTGWNSFICGHQHVTSKAIKRMYNIMLSHYPADLAPDGGVPHFDKLEGQPHVQQLTSRECLVITGSSRSEDSLRGYDIAMAHLSEVAFWKASAQHNPEDVIRAVSGTVALKAGTVVVMESTANGVGDYFHDEWLRAQAGISDKTPVFVPWHMISLYRQPVADAAALWASLNDYERGLWQRGCTLEQINWYRHKRRECHTDAQMMSEYPTTDTEAFTATGFNPFDAETLDRFQATCLPAAITGEVQGNALTGKAALDDVKLVPAVTGCLKVWEDRLPHRAYLVTVDVGGRSSDSDYSVMAVWRLGNGKEGDKPTIVAQWRGHTDYDQLAWKAAQLAEYYHRAELVIESNTLKNDNARRGDGEYILDLIARAYPLVYRRSAQQLGFHTDRLSKRKMIAALIAAVRDGGYVERDQQAVNEMREYEERDGHFAARLGKHDDILMTRAIGIYLLMQGEVRRHIGSPAPPVNEFCLPLNRQ